MLVESSIQTADSGRGSFLDINLYASFSKQVYESIIVILAKADKSLYLGIDQYLSA